MKNIVSHIAGIIFAIGLVVSGMINPQKVIGFLDIFGEWDYSLAFVMGGAVILNFFTFRMIKKRQAPVCHDCFELPTAKYLDKDLLFGSAIFGIGWGLIGICPGPGIVNLVTMDPKIFIFVTSMLVGMFLTRNVLKK